MIIEIALIKWIEVANEVSAESARFIWTIQLLPHQFQFQEPREKSKILVAPTLAYKAVKWSEKSGAIIWDKHLCLPIA